MHKPALFNLAIKEGYHYTSAPAERTLYSKEHEFIGYAAVVLNEVIEVRLTADKDTTLGNTLCIYGYPIKWMGKPDNDQ